ncbi:MAG: hypothetical protein UHJ41_04390 [Bacteroidaceae bacterium]|nr:hypothetical protein [Bacteroidaceae bacterium]
MSFINMLDAMVLGLPMPLPETSTAKLLGKVNHYARKGMPN